MINSDDKLIIEQMYRNGIDAVRIAKQLKSRYDVDTIRRHIQRNLRHLKEIHEKERERTKLILKKTAWECSQEISSLDFAKRNLSIYKANASGDLVVNRKVATDVTFDTPRRVERKLKFSNNLD